MPQPVRIRQPAPIRVYSIGFTMFWCSIVGVGAVTTRSPILIFMLAFGLAIGWGVTRLGVDADESGLVVRNQFRTRKFRWEDIEDFRTGPQGGLPLGRVIHVLLRDGQILPLDVTKRLGLWPGSRQRLDHLLTSLKNWLPPSR